MSSRPRLTPAGYAALGKNAPLGAVLDPLHDAGAAFPYLSLDDRRAAAAIAVSLANQLLRSLTANSQEAS